MRLERISEMETFIRNEKTVSNDALCQKYGISINTLRRDLRVLEERGTIRKVYGGVAAVEAPEPDFTAPKLIPFRDRYERNSDLKSQIAKAAAEHIHPNDTVFIDSGTSTFAILEHLAEARNVTIVTNNILFLYHGMNYPNLNIIVLPGMVNSGTASTIGASTMEYMRGLNIRKAFMACTALSLSHGVTNSTMEEYEIKRAIMKRCHECYLLLDHTKFNRSALMTFANVEDFQHIITDAVPSQDYVDYFHRHHVDLEIAPAVV